MISMLMQQFISENKNIIHIDWTELIQKVLQDSVNISLKDAWDID
jgi:hypothetical protein